MTQYISYFFQTFFNILITPSYNICTLQKLFLKALKFKLCSSKKENQTVIYFRDSGLIFTFVRKQVAKSFVRFVYDASRPNLVRFD